jgi:thioredoxin-related protein
MLFFKQKHKYMNSRIVVTLFLLYPFLLYAQSEEALWTKAKGWEEVKTMAKMQNKFIFIDVYATWCGPCKLMDKNVYVNDTVKQVLNKDFISIKVQMDSSVNDDEYIKTWYSDAHLIKEKYKPEGLPALLFFSPEGELAHKEIGYVPAIKFIDVAKEALTNPLGRYEQDVSSFNKGLLRFDEMPALARLANRKGQRELALNVAKKYKEKVLDQQSDEMAFSKENLMFIVDFYYDFINTNDRYFKLFYERPNYVDSIIKNPMYNNVSNFIAKNIIIKEEINNKIYSNGKAMSKPKPDWKAIQASISGKYSKINIDELFPDQQIRFYQIAGDWKTHVKYVEMKMEKYPPQKGGKLFGPQLGDASAVNMYAWNVFQNCNDQGALKAALKWSEMSIKLETRPGAITNFMDTKANLLYKLGRVKEAIEFEEKVIERNTSGEGKKLFEGNLNKMKEGVPTWVVKKVDNPKGKSNNK